MAHYLQEHSYLIPKVQALITEGDSIFLEEKDGGLLLPVVSSNSDYLAFPHHLIENYLFQNYQVNGRASQLVFSSFSNGFQNKNLLNYQMIFSFNGKNISDSNLKKIKIPDAKKCLPQKEAEKLDRSFYNIQKQSQIHTFDNQLQERVAFYSGHPQEKSTVGYHAPFKDAYVQSASAGLFLNEKNEILFLGKRKENDQILWDLPGGMMDGGEEPTQSAIREFYEEMRIRVSEDDLKLVLSDFTNGIKSMGLLGVRFVFVANGVYKESDIDLNHEQAQEEGITDRKFFSLQDIMTQNDIGLPLKRRVEKALFAKANDLMAYSSFASSLESLIQEKTGLYR